MYILYSASLDRYYVGQTEDLEKRLLFHRDGLSPYTSRASDWELKYTESFPGRSEALRRENEIKRKKSRRYIEWLISGGGQSASSRRMSG